MASASGPPGPGERTADVRLAFALMAALAGASFVESVRRERSPRPPFAIEPYRVDLNSAPAGELQALPGVGRVLGRRIVDERRHAPFSAAEDLDRVPGIGPVLVRRIAPHARCAPDDALLPEGKR